MNFDVKEVIVKIKHSFDKLMVATIDCQMTIAEELDLS